MNELSAVHRTAFGAARARARHLVAEGEPKILNDHIAQRLLGLSDEEVVTQTKGVEGRPYGASLWAMRSRYAEDRLAAAVERGVSQYVVLGAGLDSFALRNADTPKLLSIFEVDDPPLQEWKRKRLKELGMSEPRCLSFAPCDFETMSIAEALARTEFDMQAPAVVSWLGVTQYLTRSAIDETLRWASSLATGSEIVLTYVVPGEDAEKEKAMHAELKTGFVTFFTPEEISEMMLNAGLVDIEILTPKQAQSLYYTNRSDGLVAPELERLVVGKSP